MYQHRLNVGCKLAIPVFERSEVEVSLNRVNIVIIIIIIIIITVIINSWSGVLLEKLKFCQLVVETFPYCTEFEDSAQCAQQPVNCSYPQPAEFSPRPLFLLLQDTF